MTHPDEMKPDYESSQAFFLLKKKVYYSLRVYPDEIGRVAGSNRREHRGALEAILVYENQ
jgi:hypothetical protein